MEKSGKRRMIWTGDAESGMSFSLGEYGSAVEERLSRWKSDDFSRRFWSKDPTLWASRPVPEIVDRLGWLDLPGAMPSRIDELIDFASLVRVDGIRRIVILGMGGSSLAPEVYQRTFGSLPGFPGLIILDSTHPVAIKHVERLLVLAETLFLVSSKSGTTLETLSLCSHFWTWLKRGGENPGDHFAAITDPGTPLARQARERGFRAVFEAPPEVGGRYSALTFFGLVPACLIGMDIRVLLEKGAAAAEACAAGVAEDRAPGFVLGAVLGELASRRDKLTFLTTPALSGFPDWLEQLIAESLGKDGSGIVPVANEAEIAAGLYGRDRVFAGIVLEGDGGERIEARLRGLGEAGFPTILFRLSDRYDLGRDIFFWEIAVSAAGAVLGIHPFNQPDVQFAKDLAKKAMEDRRTDPSDPMDSFEGLGIEDPGILKPALEAWLSRVGSGDYISLQAFLAPAEEMTAALQDLRLALLHRSAAATTLGYGPRFLHSTGQLHKGGPNSGVFLQIVDEPEEDIPVPENDFTFGELIGAQALGDYTALVRRNRRILRVDLGHTGARGIKILANLVRGRDEDL